MEHIKILLIPGKDTALLEAFEHLMHTGALACTYAVARSAAECKTMLDSEKFDAVIMLYAPDSDITSLLGSVQGIPIIVISENSTLDRAMKETEAGGFAYLVKDADNNYLKALPASIENIRKNKKSRDEFSQISTAIEQTADSIIITNKDGVIEYVNPRFEKMTGYSREEAIGKTPRLLKSDKLDKDFYKTMWKRILAGEQFDGEFINKRKNGEIYSQEATIIPIKDDTGGIVRFVSTGRDVTENRRMETALQEANEKLIVWVNELEQRGSEIFLLSEMADLLQTCVSAEEAFTVIAESMLKLFPNDSGSLCILNESGKSLDSVSTWGSKTASTANFVPNDCWAMRRGRIHIVEDAHAGLMCKHITTPVPDSYLCVPMMAQGESLGILYLQGNPRETHQPAEVHKLLVESKQRLAMTVAEHIALSLANIKLRDTLRNQAIRDGLTGLFNRRYLEETLEREVHKAERDSTRIGLIMLDIDYFKKFNDQFGHAAGDALLRGLGNFLKTSIRAGDIPCRYGGEEFLLILLDASLEETARRAEYLRKGVQQLEIWYESKVLQSITLSLGVACFPENGTHVNEILRSADSALYKAKEGGRNRVIIHQDGEHEGKPH